LEGLGFEGTSYFSYLKSEEEEKCEKERILKRIRDKQTPLLKPKKKESIDYYHMV
jgi:hypothetical protein